MRETWQGTAQRAAVLLHSVHQIAGVCALIVLIGVTVNCGGVSRAQITTQGLYIGAASIAGTQNSFSALVLPNGKLYAIYDSSNSGVGSLFGQGVVNSGNYEVDNLLILYSGKKYTGSLTGNQQGSEFEGSVNSPSQDISWSFYGNTPSSTQYVFNTPAALTAVGGSWSAVARTAIQYYGSSLAEDGLAVSADGEFEGPQASPGGCSYAGTFTPDATYNYYDVALAYSGSCPTFQVSGVGVVTVPTASTGVKVLTVILDDGEAFTVSKP
ncbi:MAG: hypothetical protein P4M01_06875 [Acidobacteriota bacterium]|nr:hypothetical protein [Acidobacteriota bacterium]